MTMHPILTLLLDPLAGPAGFNLIAIMFYIALALLVAVAIIEQSLHNK